MKSYTIDIAPHLEDVEITVKNGKLFEYCLIKGLYKQFYVQVSDKGIKRVKQYAVKNGDDKSSCHGNWYAHCNGYAMDLCITCAGKYISINTYRPYGRADKIKC